MAEWLDRDLMSGEGGGLPSYFYFLPLAAVYKFADDDRVSLLFALFYFAFAGFFKGRGSGQWVFCATPLLGWTKGDAGSFLSLGWLFWIFTIKIGG